MSDSESETRSSLETPDAKTIEQGLRDTVAKIYKSGNLDELTVKRVRLATEEKLGLEQGFFKSHDEWKPRSDEIIKDEVEIQENPPPKPAPAPKKRQSKKRASPEAHKAPAPARKRKKATPVRSEESDVSSEEDSESEPVNKRKTKAPPAKAPSKKKQAEVDTESEQENSENPGDDKDKAPKPEAPTKATKDADAEGASESEMSVVIDEEPKSKKKRSDGQTSIQSKGKKPKSEKKRKEPIPDDPDQAEIKRLQGWLVKCGIRKVWGRELMGCNTPKEKIRHLKSMLKDVGMDGRYSIEKANRIREDRELKADLEAVQEGAKMWGANVDEEGESPKAGRSSRRIAKSFKRFDFLGQEDQDSESD